MDKKDVLISLLKSQLEDKNEMVKLQAQHIKMQEQQLKEKDEQIQELHKNKEK